MPYAKTDVDGHGAGACRASRVAAVATPASALTYLSRGVYRWRVSHVLQRASVLRKAWACAVAWRRYRQQRATNRRQNAANASLLRASCKTRPIQLSICIQHCMYEKISLSENWRACWLYASYQYGKEENLKNWNCLAWKAVAGLLKYLGEYIMMRAYSNLVWYDLKRMRESLIVSRLLCSGTVCAKVADGGLVTLEDYLVSL